VGGVGWVGWGGPGAVCCGVSGRLLVFQALRFKSLLLLHWVPGGVGLGGVGWCGVGWGGVGWGPNIYCGRFVLHSWESSVTKGEGKFLLFYMKMMS